MCKLWKSHLLLSNFTNPFGQIWLRFFANLSFWFQSYEETRRKNQAIEKLRDHSPFRLGREGGWKKCNHKTTILKRKKNNSLAHWQSHSCTISHVKVFTHMCMYVHACVYHYHSFERASNLPICACAASQFTTHHQPIRCREKSQKFSSFQTRFCHPDLAIESEARLGEYVSMCECVQPGKKWIKVMQTRSISINQVSMHCFAYTLSWQPWPGEKCIWQNKALNNDLWPLSFSSLFTDQLSHYCCSCKIELKIRKAKQKDQTTAKAKTARLE